MKDIYHSPAVYEKKSLINTNFPTLSGVFTTNEVVLYRNVTF